MKNKKLTFKDIIIASLKPGDFIFLLIDPEEFSQLSVENLETALIKFKRKIPAGVNFALLPSVKSVSIYSNQEICRLFIDNLIKKYNEHFNDIYLPYQD